MKSSILSILLTAGSIANALPQVGAGGCSPLEVVVGKPLISLLLNPSSQLTSSFSARGTSEPGTFGLIVGDPLVSAVKKAVPGATGFDIKYPADMTAASPDKGADAVVSYFATQPSKCPDQKYVIVGYSQGCVVQRRAMLKVPETIQQRIVAVVTFGDPGMSLAKMEKDKN
jgi:cutinase